MNIRALKKHLKRLTTKELIVEGMIVSTLGMKDLYIAFHVLQRRAEQYI